MAAKECKEEPSFEDPPEETSPQEASELRNLWRDVLLRLASLYFVPLVILAVFFNLQYRSLIQQTEGIHLRSVAEQQAATLDLFLSERRINLSNAFGDHASADEMSSEDLRVVLTTLKQTSPAFVELAALDQDGSVVAYAGPLPALESRSYRRQQWFIDLVDGEDSHIITDIYRGFRDQPHFTIAVKRQHEGRTRVLRAVLAPDRIYEELVSRQSDTNILSALINKQGIYQVVNPEISEPLKRSPFRPVENPRAGTALSSLDSDRIKFGYSWMSTSNWAVIALDKGSHGGNGTLGDLYRNIGIFTVIFFILGGITIWMHARITVKRLWSAKKKQDELSGQLIQCAKLASVGELASGIAHEINNPLAIVAEEVGLLKDLLDPEIGGGMKEEDLIPHLDTIHEAAFRGRDITRKLLGFVRKTEVEISTHNIHSMLDEVAEGFLGKEFELSNIKIVKEYQADPPTIVTDKNQLSQVLLNLMKNAYDAMSGSGTLTLKTLIHDDFLRISVADTGCGMSREQMEKVFVPFFTTKDPGKGTGLGLSVSQGIVESLGGTMYVESALGVGSTFTIELFHQKIDI